MKVKVWNSEADIGYKQITTFFEDFSIVDKFGADAIKDTFNRAFKEWKSNYLYLTELALVTNKKCWQHYSEDNQEFSSIYQDLYYKTRDYALDNLKDAELQYFIRITD